MTNPAASAANVDLQVPAGDDAVRPFAVEALDVRGRVVQMGIELDGVLNRHQYPASVSRLLAEAVVLTALLGTSLKFSGRFTLQTETDGPVDLMVVDYRTGGATRAYARFDQDRVAAAEASGQNAATLLGKGHLAMTIDQGSHTSGYQGIVPLQGESLEEAAHTYFRQSEQIPTRVRLAVAELQERTEEGLATSWRAGGLLVQFLPGVSERARAEDIPLGDHPPGDHPPGDHPEGAEVVAADSDDAWVEARALVDTVEDVELTDPDVSVERLLYRLFNERGVKVFEPIPLRDECSCSRDRVEGVLSGFSAEEIDDSIEDGVISVRCEFCSRAYQVDPATLAS